MLSAIDKVKVKLMEDNKRKWFVLFNVSLGIFMATLDSGIVNLALPTIRTSFNIDLATVQWVVTSYLLTISSFLPIFGRLADILGKKRLYSLGFLVFAAGSLFCGLSNSIEFLILARIFQALGASILMSLGQGIVTATFPPDGRGRALGITGSAVAVGSLFGPGVGGVLVQSFGWQSVFYINIPIGIIGFIISQMALKRDILKVREKFDYPGAILFISGTSLLFFSLSSFEGNVYSRSLLYLLLLGGIILLAGFIITELKATDPLVDLKLFKSYVFSLGVASAFIIFMTMYTTTILMPFYLQQVLSLSPALAGVTLMIFPITTAVLAPVSGWLSDRIGYGILTTIGLFLFSLGLLLMSTLTITTDVFGVSIRYIFFGFGNALFQSPNNSAVMGSVLQNKLGIAGGLNALVRNLGMISGITLSVSLLSSRLSQLGAMPQTPAYGAHYVAAMDFVYLISSVLCFIAVIISFIRFRTSSKEN